MNVRPDQLKSVLDNKQLYPVYLVSGDEPLQAMETTDLIRTTCRQQGYAEREIFEVDASFEWQDFHDEAASMSLFSSQRILDVRIPTGKFGKQGSQAIKQYLENPAEDTVVLITTGKLDKSAKNSAWFKAIDKQGMVIQCWPVDSSHLPGWVRQRFQERGMKPDDEVVDYVCQNVEGNLLAAAQEIDKIYLFVGPGEITFENVSEAITENSRYSVFDLADTVLKGDAPRAIKILNSLADEGIDPLAIIWVLVKEIRLLCLAAADPSSADYILKRSGVWGNRMPLFKSCLSRHSERTLRSLLQRCMKIEGVSKGFEQGDARDELRMLAYLLAAGRRGLKS